MNVKELAQHLNLKLYSEENGADAVISGCYIGDLLSWVMGKAKKDDAWITVMNNNNVAAVAVLCEVACIILAEGAEPDNNLLNRANNEGIPLLGSEFTAYELALMIGKLL